MSDALAIVQEAPGAPAVEEVVVPPNPIRTEPNSGAEGKPAPKADAKPSAEKRPSVREAVEAAAKKVDADDKAQTPAKPAAETKVEKPAEKADATPSRDRDATGKFIAKEGEPAKTGTNADAPTRFSNDAKAAWATAPEPVRAETHRAIRELEAGVAKYKGDADAYVPFKPFHDLAKQMNVDPAKALREYVTLDRMLGENFPAAMARICQNKGVDIRSFAADVLGLPAEARTALKIGQPQQQARAVDPEVLRLRHEVGQLQQQLGALTGQVQQRGAQGVEAEVAAFADKPLFNELSEKIAAHIRNDGLSLADAYDKAYSEFQAMAERAGLIPRANEAAPEVAADLAAQTQKGQKSIAGAPSAGSYPAAKKPSSSIRDAIRAAAAAVA